MLAVLLCGLLVCVVRLVMNGPLWGDEAMLVRSLLDRSFVELWQPLDYVQLAPLGFLWAETASRHVFGTAEWVWRLIPFLGGCFSLLAFAKFAERIVPRHAAWLATGIFASSFYLIRHTVEAKPYITDLTFALALSILGWRIQQQPQRRSRWLHFGICASVAVWCSFPSVLTAGGVLLSLMPLLFQAEEPDRARNFGDSKIRRTVLGEAPFNNVEHLLRKWFLHLRRGCRFLGGWVGVLDDPVFRDSGSSQSLRPSHPTIKSHPRSKCSTFCNTAVLGWLMCSLCLTLSFVLMYATFGQQQAATASAAGYWQMSMWDVASPPWQRPDHFVVWFLREHAGTMMAHPFGGKNYASAGTLLLVILGSITLARRNPRLLGLWLCPAGLGLLAACLQKYPYGGTARTMLYLAPAICLLAGVGGWAAIVRWIPATRRRLAYRLAMSLCLVLIAGKFVEEIATPYKERGDALVRDTVRQWAAEAKPDEVWIIANAAATPDRTDRGIYGGVSVAVFDHYVLTLGPQHVLHPREIIDLPATSGRVAVLVHESQLRPLPIDVARQFRERYAVDADLMREDIVDVGRGETLRRMIFVGKEKP